MSKTHKITKLKKRIAQLEKQLNRREILANSFKTERVTAHTVKVERLLLHSDFIRYRDQPEYKQHVIEVLMRDIIKDPTFCRCVRIEGLDNHSVMDPYLPEIKVRAAIMVLPFTGNIWED